MVALRFEIQGEEDIRKQLELKTPKEAKSILRRTMVGLAKGVRDDARVRAPQATRTLRKAIVHKRDRGTKNSVEASVWVKHGRGVKHSAFYWRFVEWGAKQAAGTPFLTPAFVRGRAVFNKFFRAEFFKQLVKKIKKSGSK
ncbi:hypothetical protein LCGC14_0424520 [marine sediment metagenome]|uniref:HK97 gp10 family phage protein n=1 Tax=marine sediment metagenome TaxID=412755 RepID=A0A0F9SPS9_9ZZZZ